MIRLALAAFLGLAALLALVPWKVAVLEVTEDSFGAKSLKRTGDKKVAPRGLRLLIAAVLLVFTGLLVLWASLFRVSVGEAVVLKSRFGPVVGHETDAGLHAKAPWTDVVRFNVRNLVINFTANKGAQDRADGETTFAGDRISTSSSDGASVDYDVTVRLSVDGTRVEDVFNTYRSADNMINNAVIPGSRSVARDQGTKYTAVDVRNQRPALEGGIRSGLESRLSALGVTVAQVDVRDIRLDAKTQENLNAIQQTRAQVEQARAKVETAKLEAESIRIRAQADSDADQISRCGAKTVKATEVINGKPQEVDRVIPVPQAECQNRLNEQVIANNWIKALEAIGANGNQIYVVQPGVNPLINLTGPAPK